MSGSQLPASLEDLIASKLQSLSLSHDEATVEFVVGIVQEETFERDDKKSAILGMLDADESDDVTDAAVGQLLEATQDYQDQVAQKARLKEEEEAEAKAKDAKASVPKKVLTPEEEAARKAEFLKVRGSTSQSYGYLEEETEAERQERAEAEAVPTSVYVDPKLLTKKARKKQEARDGFDLMAPNLNAARVRGAEQHRKEESSKAAAAKKAKDEADRKKQKEDAARKAEEKKKKAAKVERRA
ncbi:hypothetical protein T439DRAFT_351390 [Meredithblackwellia eburnea MCA 4105]